MHHLWMRPRAVAFASLLTMAQLIKAADHGPVFGLATPTNPQGGWSFDLGVNGRSGNNNLIALFKWSAILGFTVEGTAQGQILTDKIPLEMGKVADEELGFQGWQHLQSLRRLTAPVSDAELAL